MLEVIVGNRGIKISSRLLDVQNAWDNLPGIRDLHKAKLLVYAAIDRTDGVPELVEYTKQITAIEFKLQELWGFPQDIKFHRFWETPKCLCPVMDNRDAYPTGRYYINSNCMLHGGGNA